MFIHREWCLTSCCDVIVIDDCISLVYCSSILCAFFYLDNYILILAELKLLIYQGKSHNLHIKYNNPLLKIYVVKCCINVYYRSILLGFYKFSLKRTVLYFSESVSLCEMLNFIYTGKKAEGGISLEHHFVFS